MSLRKTEPSNPLNLTSWMEPMQFLATVTAVFLSFGIVPAGAIGTPPSTAQTVSLAWDSVPETPIRGYKVYVGTQSQQYTQTFDAGLETTFPVTPLDAGATYYFAVSAIGSTGLESELSDEIAFTTAPPFVALGIHTMRLGWIAAPEPDVASYRVQVGTRSKEYDTSYDAGPVTVFPISGLEFGKTYYFVVSAIGSGGLEGDLSDELAVTIAPPPLPGGSRLISSSNGSSGLQWTFPRSGLGSSPEFVVMESEDLVNWKAVATVIPDQSTGGDSQSVHFSWPLQVTGAKMFYRLTARNWMGESMAP
jgi:hypothetical protein